MIESTYKKLKINIHPLWENHFFHLDKTKIASSLQEELKSYGTDLHFIPEQKKNKTNRS